MNLSLTRVIIKMDDNLKGLLSLKNTSVPLLIFYHIKQKGNIRTEIIKKCIENELRIATS